MAAYVVRPSLTGHYPALILFHAVLGLTHVWRDVAEELAQHGFVVAAPDLYHRTGHRLEFPDFPGQRDEAFAAAAATGYATWTQDARAVINFLKGQRDVVSARIGAYGHCYGGAVAFVVAAELADDIHSILMVCPSDMLRRAVSPNYPVPPFEFAATVQADVLCLSGSADRNPSPADVKEMASAMRAAGKPFESHIYDGEPPCGHAFFERDLPFYNEAAVRWAWPIKLDFLRRTLQAPRGSVP
jgi:carboxymethylenebutenolidase